ncbi:MAG: hypothetical protein DYG83_03165 [Candidatus Brocadia sp. AMX2]|uniref:KOW domain-containing protein n=1 Tax=Candidatus Brocadia sinica JPN1 TaxID=1197129 RepID=A0ABQ0JWQ3_9BACT|nr:MULTISPECIES: hypothetical protein [Brocadia]KXK29595.1 MAG: hypothetical protein UZ01_01970 [Candidatus Brocadia sinica]MBC6931151.1 hypothetical protein [Candidatus Brocadia sp.]MBL1167450.1 hypothetical protein [Candidatus Brocadia sp. AMX1]NOG41077.1 hypothetical protein [Planctomycetota bacterium]KAA0244678.1 MAG: hypothetical protein EDM70_05635 [Candidatus Brocadia sp. AMX2]
MTHAYTPGLRISERTRVTSQRVLPLRGDVIVGKGDTLKAEDVVASTHLPGKIHAINAVNRLGIQPKDIREYMLKKEGDAVRKDEIIAETKPWIKILKTVLLSPITGTIETISTVTGQVLLRETPKPIQVFAFVDGTVTEVMEKEGVVMETTATFIQGIFGVGGETVGELVIAVNKSDDILTTDCILPTHKDKIIVGGSFIQHDAMDKARKIGVKGIIVGGLDDKNLKKLLGYDLGVAITGSEEIGITLIITEGFGQIQMAQRTFELLKSRSGAKTSINGATQIRAGVVRPEIIIPYSNKTAKEELDKPLDRGMEIGDTIRVIRVPYFGKIGKIKALPFSPLTIETEATVRILEVEFPDGSTAIVPRANVEMIET